LDRLFHNPATYLHTPYTTKHSVVGTLPFTSINGQQGHAQSHRDDLESLAYTITFLARSHLPWTAISVCKNHDKKAVLRKKMTVTTEELCEGLPPPFSKFVVHVHSLGFNEKPDYQYLHSILLQCSEIETEPTEAPPSSPCISFTPISSDRV
jgi:hypothetical protein